MAGCTQDGAGKILDPHDMSWGTIPSFSGVHSGTLGGYIRGYIRGTFGYIRAHEGAFEGYESPTKHRKSVMGQGTFAACTHPFYNIKKRKLCDLDAKWGWVRRGTLHPLNFPLLEFY